MFYTKQYQSVQLKGQLIIIFILIPTGTSIVSLVGLSPFSPSSFVKLLADGSEPRFNYK